jgi:cytochrome c biogenesis protein
VYLVHLSVILILIGAIIGSFFGFKGFVNIIEGDSVEYVELRNQPAHTHKDLGFTVNCDKFSVDFYENGTPKEYTSEIRFSIDGETVKQGLLMVNHPLTFKGITFYQSSYGSIPGNSAHLIISQKNKAIESSVVHAEKGEPLSLPNGDGEFQLAEVIEDFMRLGPAVSILIKPPEGDIIQFWIFKNHDSIKQKMPDFFERYAKMNPSIFAPYTFALADIETGSYYTGLQVNKDPGIFFVYLGFFVIVVGLFITFFSSHRRIWISISESQGKTVVSIAGSANKNPVGLERELDRLTEQFKNIVD